MLTLRLFAAKPATMPQMTAWYLADVSESLGKQDLFTHQTPQRLKVLREHALIESAVSSNRIEGVTVKQSRIATLVFGKPLLRDREEEEVRGYRNALKLIHERGRRLELSESTIRQLHTLSRGASADAGRYKASNNDIIERFPDGREQIRFKTVTAARTPRAMKEFALLLRSGLEERWTHPLVLMAAANLDFLCIHPFRDGNGRVSRLLFLLQCYHLGFEVGRYISLERLIEQNKERYYETLHQCSQGWHEGKHDPWPYINYLLYILKTAYKEFEARLGQVKSPRGAKTGLIEAAVNAFKAPFRLGDLERACPGVSRDMIRVVLRNLRSDGKVVCLGKGPSAQWQKKR